MGVKLRKAIIISVLFAFMIGGILILYPYVTFYYHFEVEYDTENQGYILKSVNHWKKENLTLPDTIPNGSPIIGLNSVIQSYRQENDTIKQIIIPDTYERINSGAFNFLPALEQISLGKNVTGLYGGMFATNVQLSKISIDSDHAFYISEGNCIIDRKSKQLIIGCKDSEIPTWVESIGEAAFAYVEFAELTIPSCVKKIGASAFYRCRALEKIVISENVTEILHSAFYECPNLRIYCVLSQKPSGWDDQWCDEVCDVVWNYEKGE